MAEREGTDASQHRSRNRSQESHGGKGAEEVSERVNVVQGVPTSQLCFCLKK